MYYIYVDEAGTSALEPVTVVAAVIVHADTQWKLAHSELNRLLDLYVPSSLREGFIFHAKEIWSGYRSLNEPWPMISRKKLIEEVSSIPRRLKMAISIGRVRRDAPQNKLPPETAKKINHNEFQHIMAFGMCIRRANSYVRKWASENEIATVVAEDVPKLRRYLRNSLNAYVPLEDWKLLPTKRETATGKMTQTNSGPIDKIIDTVHFVEKNGAPLLQIADACAFSFRRYFASQSGGEILVKEMLGWDLDWEDWQGPCSEMVFYFVEKNSAPISGN